MPFDVIQSIYPRYHGGIAMKKVRITAIRITCYPDLMEKEEAE